MAGAKQKPVQPSPESPSAFSSPARWPNSPIIYTSSCRPNTTPTATAFRKGDCRRQCWPRSWYLRVCTGLHGRDSRMCIGRSRLRVGCHLGGVWSCYSLVPQILEECEAGGKGGEREVADDGFGRFHLRLMLPIRSRTSLHQWEPRTRC